MRKTYSQPDGEAAFFEEKWVESKASASMPPQQPANYPQLVRTYASAYALYGRSNNRPGPPLTLTTVAPSL